MKTLFVSLCLLFFSGISIKAVDYYVSTTGSDSAPGSLTQPFRTITYAYSKAVAGTTIIVLPGVYTDYRPNWGLHFGRSGTATSPITIKSQVRGGAVIEGNNNSDRHQGIYLDGSYNVIEGFKIRGGPHGGIAIWANGNKIINNEIYNNGNPASTSQLGQDGVYSSESTQDTVYRGNYIHDNGRVGSNLDHALYLCGNNELVINNVLFRNASYGVHIAGYDTVNNMKIYNNVMAYNGRSGIIFWMSVKGIDVRNNIIYKNAHYGVDSYDAHGSGINIDKNVIYGNVMGNYSLARGGSDFTYTLGTTINSEPLFVNSTSAGFDSRLAAGSPAINSGVNLYSIFTTDIAGTTRPSTGAWDMGAYKYGTTVTPPVTNPPAPPQSLTIRSVSGIIKAPFVTNKNDTISQPSYTSLNGGGQATYSFSITNAGKYIVSILVSAPSEDNNSCWINIDGTSISDPLMIWDMPITSGLVNKPVSWRGNGGPSSTAAQYSPKVFDLTAGKHSLIIRGREGNCQLGTITISPQS